MSNLAEVKVWGPYACFTRDEAAVERVSYEVMTPAAARNVMRAIFWKPEFDWEVREIVVLKPIRWASMARNEVGDKVGASMARTGGFYADEMGVRKGESARRVQRSGLILRDVCYVIRASLAIEPHAYGRTKDPVRKYRGIFEERLTKGRCFHQPYLGMREHHAFFERPDGEEEPIDVTADLGPMRYDVVYEQHEKGPVRVKDHAGRETKGGVPTRVRAFPKTMYMRGRLEKGVLRVPPRKMMLRAAGIRRPVGWSVEGL